MDVVNIVSLIALLAVYFTGMLVLSVRSDDPSQNSMEKFYLANHTLSVPAIAMSFAATWFAAASTQGMLNAYAREGLHALWFMPIPGVASLVITSLFFVRQAARNNALTIPEAIEQRFGRLARLMMTLAILVGTTTSIAAQLVAVGQLLGTVTGLPTQWVIPGTLLPVVAYCTVGGYRAVVVTDRWQLGLLTLGLSLLLIPGVMAWITGTSLLWASQPLPAGFTQLTTQPWTDVGTTLVMVLAWSLAPEMWQRAVSAGSPEKAVRATWLASGLLFALMGLVACIALGAFAAFPLAVLQKTPSVLVLLAQALPHPALTLLVLVGFLAAVTSTVDSMINVGSLTVSHDLYGRYWRPQATMAQRVRVSRWATVGIALPALCIALQFKEILPVLWLAADVAACTLFVPLCGVLFLPAAPKPSGVAAMITGACFAPLSIWQSLSHGTGVPWPWPVWPFSTLLGVAASAAAFGVAWWASRTLGAKPATNSGTA